MENKELKLISIPMIVALLLTALAGCGAPKESPATEPTPAPVTEPTSAAEPMPETVTITDATGREITLDLPVERVAYLHPTVGQALRIVDAWDKVIAIDNYTTDAVLFPDIANMPVITYSDSGTIDYEMIIELQPDVLLVLPSPGTIDIEDAIATLEPEITVISVFDTYAPDVWKNGIALLGTIMQQEAEAQEFISFIQDIETNISSQTEDLSRDEKPTVFIKTLGWAPEDFCTYTNEFSFVSKLMDVCGAVNIAADLPSMGGWVQEVDQEWLMFQECEHIFVQVWDAYNPDAVGFQVQNDSVMAGLREEVMGMSAFEDSKAVEDGNVYMIDTNFLTSLDFVVMLEYMAKMVHPELFADLDPEATFQEYLERFIRVDVDLDDGGIFFYSES
jgi:iron complex transport system substrate-binding protein